MSRLENKQFRDGFVMFCTRLELILLCTKPPQQERQRPLQRLDKNVAVSDILATAGWASEKNIHKVLQ